LGLASKMSHFNNAQIEIEQVNVENTARGPQATGRTTVLLCRGDLQENGRELQRQREVYQDGDALFYPEAGADLVPVDPGDEVTLTADDGRVLTGSVAEVDQLSSALLLTIDYEDQ